MLECIIIILFEMIIVIRVQKELIFFGKYERGANIRRR